MRARELRDVIEVLIVPSLERALNELSDRRGSRRKARLLVQQSVDQLFGMMVVDKKPEPRRRKPSAKETVADFEVVNPANPMPPVLKPGERLPLDHLDDPPPTDGAPDHAADFRHDER